MNTFIFIPKIPKLCFICYFPLCSSVCCEATLSSVWGRVQFQKINFAGVCDDSQSNSNIMKTHKIGNKSFKSSSRYNENRGAEYYYGQELRGDELIKKQKRTTLVV